MLSEIFMLRLETTLRMSNTPTLGTKDTRFVAIKAPSASPTKDSPENGVLIPRRNTSPRTEVGTRRQCFGAK
jgi:hypothetical protein